MSGTEGGAGPGTSKPAASRRRLAALALLAPFLRRYWPAALGASAALIATASLTLAVGQGLRHLIDQGFAQTNPDALNHTALAMFAIVAALAIGTYVRFSLVSWLGERIAGDLRRAVFNNVIALSPGYFETARTGDILSRMTADVALLQSLIGSSVSMWLRNLLSMVGALIMLLLTSLKLTALIVLVVPLVVAPAVLFGRRERSLSRRTQDRIGDLGAYAEETLTALTTVQDFTHEAIDIEAYGQRAEAAVRAAIRRIRTRAVLIVCVILLGFGAIIGALWVGGHDVIAGRMTGGGLAAFVFYAVLLASSGATLSELWGEVQRAAGAAERIGELLAARPDIAAPANPQPLPSPVRGEVRFSAVGFAYPSRPVPPALNGIDFTVAPGETVALVGPSGAGKSTIFHLLLRHYDVQSGSVMIDGVDVRALDPRVLRQQIAVVAQDPTIFSATAGENVRYGRPEASDAELHAAISAAAADFLFELPEGLNTYLGERGVRLSGGQRQRVAIARAILRRAPILLLDEATSALDAESEQAVQHALTALAHDRTTLVVAHRLATIRRADRILVIDGGAVVASGTHEALAQQSGLYARLAALQFNQAQQSAAAG